MTDLTADPAVTRDDAESRYEIRIGDVLAGYTEFRIDTRGRLVFPHTVVDPAFRGKGLATVLIERAMTDVSARGETIVPRCPAVVKYLRAHEVAGLLIDWPS